MNDRKIIFLLITIFIFLNCGSNESGYDKAYKFYAENKSNDSFEIFSNSLTTPFRHLYRINALIYIEDYNTESIDNLKAQLQNKESMLYGYIEDHKKDKEEILNYIHKIYSSYKNLGVLGIHGRRTYIKFIITPEDILLFILNNEIFNEDQYLNTHGLKNIQFEYFDSKWIYYKLPDNKKYDFY